MLIYGKHAVLEAVEKRPECVRAIYADDREPFGRRTIRPFKDIARDIPRDAVHQRYAAELDDAKLMVPWKRWKEEHTEASGALVVLGELHDPHNIGAIIRSATAFGVAGVLLPEHRGAPLTAAAIKASAGTAFSIPLIATPNLNDALRTLREMGFWIYGLDGAGETSLPTEQFTRPAVFVVGNEGAGIREKTRDLCDQILSIPIQNAESLNASVAAAITFYAWSAQKK